MWFACEPVALGFTERSPFHIENVRVIDASPAHLFEILANGDIMRDWFPDVVSARWYGTPGGLGSEREVILKTLKVKERFIAWDEGKRLTFHAYAITLPIVTALVEDFTLEPITEGGKVRTRFTWRAHYAPTLAARLVHPVIRFVFGKMFANAADGLARYARAHAT
jgi:uncharacterized protein YndB with AHSA1/START domain